MSYKINFKSLRQEGLKPLFDTLENAFTALDIDFYILGAVARDTWLVKYGLMSIGTNDLDFAVYIASKGQYKLLTQYLCEKHDFKASKENTYKFYSPGGLEVDLLPFGDIEIEGKLMLDGTGMHRISANGFKEVYEFGTEKVAFENDKIFNVCTLPGIVILKLIAYDDRPELRQKDIQDIRLILKHYFSIETDLIYDRHIDLFGEEIEHVSHIAARVLGRQMKAIFVQSKHLEERIISILKEVIEHPKKSRMAQLMVAGTEQNIDSAIEILKELLKGIQDE